MTPAPGTSVFGCFAFGPFVLDTARCLLWHNGTLHPVPRKTLSLLALLVTRHGEVVQKDEIFAELWGGAHVGENTIARHVATLRKVLGETSSAHTFIVTVSGRGYRFVADVRSVAEPPDRSQRLAAPSPLAPPPEVERAEGPPDRAEAPIERGPWQSAVSAVGLAALAVVFYVTAVPGRPIDARESARVVVLTAERGLQESPSWSPDGTSLAFSSDRSGNADIWVRSVDGTSLRQVTDAAEHDTQPAWSPDGRWIAYRSEHDGGGIYVVPAAGGVPARLTDRGYSPQWSPDGTVVLVSHVTAPHLSAGERLSHSIVSLDGLHTGVPAARLSALSSAHVAWLPSGRGLSISGFDDAGHWRFATLDPFDADRPLDYWNIAPAVSSAVDRMQLRLSDFAWAPGGDALYFEEGSRDLSGVWRVEVNGRARRLESGPTQLLLGASVQDGVAVSGDGKIALAMREAQTRIWSYPLDERSGRITGTGAPVTPGGADERDPVVSPDGSRLVYRTDHGSRQDVWLRSLDDGAERRLLGDDTWRRSNPHWSHDGTRLAYARSQVDRTGGRHVVVLTADDNQESVLATSIVFAPTGWTPDDSRILGHCRGERTRSYLCAMPAQGAESDAGRITVLAADDGLDLHVPRLSPDERSLSFTVIDPNRPEVSTLFVAPATGARPWTRISGEEPAWDDKSRWSPDGRTVYWVSTRAGISNVWARQFNTAERTPVGPPFQVTHFTSARQAPARQGMELVITRDRLMLPVTEVRSNIYLMESAQP